MERMYRGCLLLNNGCFMLSFSLINDKSFVIYNENIYVLFDTNKEYQRNLIISKNSEELGGFNSFGYISRQRLLSHY